MVQILTDMMCERLALYKKRNKKLPERVIVYRDGVSEVLPHMFFYYSHCQIDLLQILGTISVGEYP